MCICTHVHMYICTYVHIYIYSYIHIYVYAYVHIYRCAYTQHIYMFSHIHICTDKHMHICTYAHMYIYIYILDSHMAPEGACEAEQSEFEQVQWLRRWLWRWLRRCFWSVVEHSESDLVFSSAQSSKVQQNTVFSSAQSSKVQQNSDFERPAPAKVLFLRIWRQVQCFWAPSRNEPSPSALSGQKGDPLAEPII